MFRSVRSSADERSRRLPGDELLAKTISSSLTHAITIRRPPHVADAGGWKDVTTLVRCYQQTDELTLLAVMANNLPEAVRTNSASAIAS